MKKNLPLIIGLAIPVLMIVFVAIAVYAPSFFAHPKYSFVFSTGDTYPNDYGDHYSVVNNVITKTTNPYPQNQGIVKYSPRPINLFVYDAQADTVRSITFEDAQKLKVDVSPKSPDGYVLERGDSNNGIFDIFGSSQNYNSWFLKNGIISKRIYLTAMDNSYYYSNYNQFLGWITSGNFNNQ